MQITVNNDFNNGGQFFTQAQINSFLQDEQTAINIFQSTFTSNVSVVFNVGFGSYQGVTLNNQFISEADVNQNAVFFLTYSQLRQDLLAFGQPGFFNAANLPAGTSLNGRTNFCVSSSVGACFGLFTQEVDGFVAIGTGFTPGAERVSAFLHELGHAMGRVPENIGGAFSALDLVRFVSQGNRLFDGSNPNDTFAYFSLDGGATQIAQWGQNSDVSDFRNGFPFANDPFNENVGNLGQLTNADILVTEALGFKTVPPAPQAIRRRLPAPRPTWSCGTAPTASTRSTTSAATRLLAAYQLGQVGTDWRFVTLAGFFGNDTTDMLLRNARSGGFEVYDISNNNITRAAFLGNVGLDWQVMGFGNFSSFGETDMMLRNVNNGGIDRLRHKKQSNHCRQLHGFGWIGLAGRRLWQFFQPRH